MCWGAIKDRRRLGRTGFVLYAAVLVAAAGPTVRAATNITSDGTLGTNVASPVAIPGGAFYGISGGRIKGSNQFHSFDGFSIGAGDAALFNGPNNIANIISRVTGGSVSSINGTIASSIPGANLFLLNPAGVVFGPNAQLAIGGAFHASTADYLRLGDGNDRFYVDPDKASSFTSAAPAAFGFLDANPAGISVQGSLLPSFMPADGTDIGLVGGEITVDGALIYAPLGRVNLAAVGRGNATGVEAQLTDGAVDVGDFEALGDVNVGGGAIIDTGELYIRGGQITVAGAFLSPGVVFFNPSIPLSAPAAHLNNGLVDIRASGDLTITPGAGPTVIGSLLQTVFLESPAFAGNGVNVLLEAGDTLSIQGIPGRSFRTIVASERWQDGAAGTLDFSARHIEIIGTNDIYASNYAPGPGPDATVDAQTLLLNGGAIGAFNFGPGDNGVVAVTADVLSLTNEFGPAAIGAQNRGIGAGGAVIINADHLALDTPGAAPVLISGSTFGPGSGASVRIGSAADPADMVELNGAGAAARILTSTDIEVGNGLGFGPAGDIEIHTGVLRQVGNTEIGANSFTDGDGGNVVVVASDAVLMTGSDPATESVIAAGTSEGQFAGRGGSVTIVSPLLEMENATITTRTGRAADAGDVEIRVGDLTAVNATITAETRDDGDAGDVIVTADRVALLDGAQIRSFSGAVNGLTGQVLVGTGDAGSVTVTARESISVSGSSSVTNRTSALSTQTRGDGAGGALNVVAGRLTVGEGGLVAADTGGDGAGGTVSVSAGEVLVDGGEISSGSGISVIIQDGQVDLVGSGDGGDVIVQAQDGVIVQNDGRIAASSRGPGDAGDIRVDGGSEVRLLDGSIDTESQISDGGDIKVLAEDIVYLSGGRITTSVVGAGGTGGNIDIDPQFVILQNGSQVIANATNPLAERAGNITITGDYILISQDSLVQASGPTNERDGEILIRGPDGDLDRALAQLPESYLQAAALLQAGCGAGRAGASTLVLSGRGGVPVSPDGYVPSLTTGLDLASGRSAVREESRPEVLPGELLAFGPSDPTAAGWQLADLGCR